MEVIFLGTGEAFGNKANTSLLVNKEILIDCSPHSVLQIRKLGIDIKEIKIVFVSHWHGDHFLGLPALLLAASEENREEPLTLIGTEGIEKIVRELLLLSYNKSIEELSYDVSFITAEKKLKKFDYIFDFAPLRHSIPSIAVSVIKNKKLTYACDGLPDEKVVSLAKDSDLLVAEAYGEGFLGHSSPAKAAEVAKKATVKLLALVHLYRYQDINELKMAGKIFSRIVIPEDLETIKI